MRYVATIEVNGSVQTKSLTTREPMSLAVARLRKWRDEIAVQNGGEFIDMKIEMFNK